MTTLKEEAEKHEPKQKLNIADLDVVPVDMEIQTLTGTDAAGEKYTYKAFVDGEKEYYISGAVLVQMKEILKLKPDVAKFSVTKTGSGLATKYKVEALV
tara:strand:- start:874 stop:1170 length:297 start_codon:yes stop_codon:yes gene_type:complete